MNLIISSEADTASINLRDRLLEMAEWNEIGSFDDRTMWTLAKNYGGFCKKGTCLITIKELHIYAEKIDKVWETQFGRKIDKQLGIFAEGKYNKYWNREWYDFKFGINYIIR